MSGHKFTHISCAFGMMRAAFGPVLPAPAISQLATFATKNRSEKKPSIKLTSIKGREKVLCNVGVCTNLCRERLLSSPPPLPHEGTPQASPVDALLPSNDPYIRALRKSLPKPHGPCPPRPRLSLLDLKYALSSCLNPGSNPKGTNGKHSNSRKFKNREISFLAV